MHNNSLRRQIAWQNRNQSRILRKNTRFVPEDSPTPPDHSSNTIIRVSNDCNQHSELKWLEKVVSDMKRYKIDPKQEQSTKKALNHSVSYGIKKNIIEEKSNILAQRNKSNVPVSQEQCLKKVDKLQADNKKSGKKIKFQVISNKENRVTSGRKSSSKITESSHRPAKKISQASSKSHIKATKTASDYKSCQPTKKQDVMISPCLTEEISNIQTKEDIKCLWEDRSHKNESFIALNRSYDERKSAGKIIKNQQQRFQSVKSQSLSSTFVQKSKSKNYDVSSYKKHQKVFLKLDTQNLSKYLGESEIKQEKVQQKNEQQQQYILFPLKRQLNARCQPFQLMNIRCEDLEMYERTQGIQKVKNVQIQSRVNQLSRDYRKNIAQIILKDKERVKNVDKKEQQQGSGVKTKGQQRKLNQRSHNNHANTTSTTLQDKTQDQAGFNSAKDVPSLSFQFKKYEELKQKDIQIKKQPIAKPQKLFTLYSQGEEHKFQMQLPQESASLDSQYPTKYVKLNNQQSLDAPLQKTEIQEVICPSVDKLQQQKFAETNMSPSFFIEKQEFSMNVQKQLTLLFNFLDQNKRRLLTSSNCRVEGLTEELKLMFSSIINQIKTKKRAFTLEKFITQSKSVMEVKKEVYSSNSSQTKANIITQILKENIEILKKKSPLELIKQTHTKSILQTNQNSKRSSLADNQSIVISKMVLKEASEAYQSLQLKKDGLKGWSQPLEMQEPENYFKKKYGIVDSGQIALSSDRQLLFSSQKQANLQQVGTF